MKKRCLISLYDTKNVVEYGRLLFRLGWEIIASKETVKLLSGHNIPVRDVAGFTGIKEDYGFPPTLHPKIEAALTKNNSSRIDLVYVIPYPLSVGNDVGGRALLALAVKGRRIPVMSVEDMAIVIRELEKNKRLSKTTLQRLWDKTSALIAGHYDDLLVERKDYDLICGTFQSRLLNGENPYQVPAELFAAKGKDKLALSEFKQISGEPPCFTNFADADSILHTLCLSVAAFTKNMRKHPFICLAAKHGNACGLGASWKSARDAIEKALWGNPSAVWGGEVIVNFRIDNNLARVLFISRKRGEKFGNPYWMPDIILAPEFSPGAIKILGARKQRKLFENPALSKPTISSDNFAYRFVRQGFLRQPRNNFVLDFARAQIRGFSLDRETQTALIIAWAAAWSSNHGGNEIALAKNGMLLSAGGAASTVEAAEIAVSRARKYGHQTEGAVFGTNAFFPFTDAPEILVKAKMTAGLVPAGGRNEKAVRSFFKKNKTGMIYLKEKFRGFSRH